ncbi:ankyrin repeat and SOCS box protein 1 isoform X1 [Brienomyrus brachyistius]|uniref:ankyrin repeat and SOCS box protein 1 isoform X1 n=1 Tax=Brienomyrus brachyistius TaxID=42636 RepID=UPI0020B31BB7|nr:ankyrin repeat and SOCS box protein 1 isoform X1 [Brienomyrus brachyistius]
MADGGDLDGDDDPPNIGNPVVTVSDMSGTSPAGRNLKEWLQEQYCDKPLEQCDDMRLHNAAYVGDLDTLRSLLQEDSFKRATAPTTYRRINEKSVWCCGWLPCTPLRIAATAGHSDCVAFLISQGAEVDLVDVKGQTALYVAVVNGHLDCVRILLEASADPNGSRHHRSTPVYHASRVGRVDILKELIRFDADVDVDHQLGPRPLFSARTLSSLVVCPLYISAAYHHLGCFRVLLQAGADPDYNYTGPVCREALQRGLAACLLDAVLRHGCEPAFVRLLLEHGANPNLVPWDEHPGLDAVGRVRLRMEPEALRLYQEARRIPRRLTHLCRICVRRALGKCHLGAIPSLPLPDTIKLFLLHEDR